MSRAAESTADGEIDERVVRWSHTPADMPWLRTLLYVVVGLIGGTAILFGLGVVIALGVSVWNNPALAFVYALLSVLLLRAEIPVILAMKHPRGDQSSTDGAMQSLDRRWIIVASVLGAIAGITIMIFLPSGSYYFLVLFAVVVPLGLTVLTFSTKGELDPETRTLRSEQRELSLDGLAGVRRFRLGGIVLHWLSFADGTLPRPIVLPATVENAARTVFRGAIAYPTEEREPDRLAQFILVSFALACFAGVSGFLFLTTTRNVPFEAVAVVAYGLVPLGLLFLATAYFKA